MQHRHLNHREFSPAAIDDIISRGKWRDWRELRQAALNDRDVMERIARISAPVLILGSLDGIETGVRQLIREAPLETEEIERFGVRLRRRADTVRGSLRQPLPPVLGIDPTNDTLADHRFIPVAMGRGGFDQ